MCEDAIPNEHGDATGENRDGRGRH